MTMKRLCTLLFVLLFVAPAFANQSNRQAALARIFASEQGFAIRATEPGGAVKDGITMLVYRQYHTKHGLPVPSVTDLQNMSVDEKTAIYNEIVFEPLRFDDLPSGVDYAIADFSANYGLAGALNAVRFLYNVPIPAAFWRMDNILLATLKAQPFPALVVNSICDLRWSLMQAHSDFITSSAVVPGKILGDGRAFRMSAVHRGAMEMLGFAPEADKYAAPKLTPLAAANP